MSALNVNPDLIPRATVENNVLFAAVRGDIDLHNSPELRTLLLEAVQTHGVRCLVLDLGQVPYMDSSAIAVLVEALQRLRRTSGKIVLHSLQPRVRGLLEIARLDTIFTVASDEADARTHL